MMHKFLRLFKTESLVKEIVRRDSYLVPEEVPKSDIWREAFGKVPELADFMRAREIVLLKSLTLKKFSDQPIVLGQIAENRMWLLYDVPREETVVKVGSPEIKTAKLSEEQFLGKWNKENANKRKTGEGEEKEDVGEGSVSRN